VKTRPEARVRHVEHTIDGATRLVPETYTVHIPVPPRDWDRTVLRGVTGAAAGIVLGSIAWTTTNVGDLLTATVPAPIAYIGAAAYDVPWISCLALEWLARYDADRARAPRHAGHVALAVAMAAVIVHGYVVGALAAGIVGAVISAIAKGLWTLVMRHTAQPLDTRTQEWLRIRRGEVGARLALSAELRRLDEAEDHHAAALAAQQPDARPTPAGLPVTGPSAPPTPEPPTPASPPPPAATATAADETALTTPPTPADDLRILLADAVRAALADAIPPKALSEPAEPHADAPLPPDEPPLTDASEPPARRHYDDPRYEAIRELYETGYRPGTLLMRRAVEAATGEKPGDSTLRTWRGRIETAEPHLEALPAAAVPLRTA
jgi:hypothetical protein